MTKKIAEKRWGRAMYGALMLFEQTVGGHKEEYSIGRFVSNIARYGRGTGKLASSMYYFAPSGKYGGGGTLTPLMAADAVEFIQTSIRAGGNNPRYKGPPMKPLGDECANWKSKVSNFRGKPLMTLTDNTAAAIGMRKSAGGRVVVTVNGDRVAPSPAPGTVGVPLAKYVYVHEYGTGGVTGKIPHRPIITGSMLGWIALRSHSWKVAFQRLLKETVWMGADRGSKEDLADDIIVPRGDGDDSSYGNSAIDVLASLNRKADRLDSLAKTVSKVAANLIYKTARRAKDTPYSAAEVAKLKPILMREMAGSGYSSEKVSEIIDIAFGGRIPREYLYDD